MKIKPAGKFMLFLVVMVAAGFGAYKYLTGSGKDIPFLGGTGSTGSGGPSPDISGDKGLLGRPLRVGVVTWPGYAGGIVANNGFKPNKDCIFWNNHKILVEFMLMEDVDARAKAFAKGGADGVDIVWSTVDFWANELPGFIKGGTPAKAIMQVDWSRGGDAIVVSGNINRIEDLVGKKIALALFTPSHWLLESALRNSSLDTEQQNRIVKSLVGKVASPDARTDFVAGKVDAAVVWEPDVAEALAKRPGSRVLLSTKTADRLIADLMVARDDFIKDHPDVIRAFVKGWFDGTEEANRRPDAAVRVLMDNEPLYKELGNQVTLEQLSTVRWADLSDNIQMFGLDGKEPLFDRIFIEASRAWAQRGYISSTVAPSTAKYLGALKDIYAKEGTSTVKQPDDTPVPRPKPADITKPEIMSKPVNIFFPSGSSTLDDNAKQLLEQTVSLAKTYSNAYIRIEGNTDSRGSQAMNVALSKRRAEAVVNYMVRKYNFNRNRLIAVGNGPNKPKASNDTDAGRAKNRRTDIEIVAR